MGGLIPLIPYMLISNTMAALYVSLSITLATLFTFGFVKARLLGTPRPWVSALQMALVGGTAAGCAFGIAKAIPQPSMGPHILQT